MKKKFRFYMVLSFGLIAFVSWALGLGIGIWTILNRADIGIMLLWGFLGLVISLLFGLGLAYFFSRKVVRALGEIQKLIADLEQLSQLPAQDTSGPLELEELYRALFELKFRIEHRFEEKQKTCTEEAQQHRIQSLQIFGQGVKREIQSSLSGVVGYAELALRQPEVQKQLKNYLTLIEQEARTTRETLDKILRFVHDDSQAKERLDINLLVLEASQVVFGLSESKRIKVQLNLGQEHPWIYGDALQLKFVVQALLQNAKEAILPKGGDLTISTTLNQDRQLIISVQDTGRGMALSDQAKIFTPFFTTKEASKGCGFSLAVAQHIVSSHHGKITFFSETGTGSVFFINLPILEG